MRTPRICRVPHITTRNQFTATHQVVVREANSDTSSTASVQGMTVTAIHSKCSTERSQVVICLLGL